jgi:hypothetical protein
MKRSILLWIALGIGSTLFGRSALSVSGYVKDMLGFYRLETPIHIGSSTFQSTAYNLVHQRFNLTFFPDRPVRLEAGIRNRWMTGPMVKDLQGYAQQMERDNGWMDLSATPVNGTNGFLNTSIDRLYLDADWGHLNLRLGRQRINWGMTLVWNPNDLFNAYSYFDFDYEERPGSDALRATIYLSATTSIDAAFKKDHWGKTTLAARFLTNLGNTDWQFLAGQCADDNVVGGGFSGSVEGCSLRGEASWFFPRKGNTGPSSLSATIESDYTLPNQFYLHAAYLYNSNHRDSTAVSLLQPGVELSAKRLSLGKHELFAQCAYPVSPLLNAGMAGMWNPTDGSSYLSPSATLSLSNNLELLLTAQILLGQPYSEYGSMGRVYAGFGRIKWNF